jgi:hypothetical protein
MKITRFNSLKKMVAEGKIQASIRGYREGVITSPKGIVEHFALMLSSGAINGLPAGDKRVAQDLVDARYLTQSGRVLRRG